MALGRANYAIQKQSQKRRSKISVAHQKQRKIERAKKNMGSKQSR